MQCERDLITGKRIFGADRSELCEDFICKYSEKFECYPIDAICEIREYMNRVMDEIRVESDKMSEK